tara:strand:- start:149 stop:304 length:156 start_codon:yes stop_codon:yes gene_type:complete
MVGKVCGEKAQDIFWEMPLIEVYAWEHYAYRVNGIDVYSVVKENNLTPLYD